MIFSTSSFRKFVVMVFLGLTVPGVGMLAATEWLVRTQVIPADRVAWQLERFSNSDARNVVLGDSHAAMGIHGVPGFENFSLGGDNLQVLSGKVDALLRRSPPIKVIIQADPSLISLRRDGQNSEDTASLFRESGTPLLWSFQESHRPNLFDYWRIYLAGDGFSSKETLHSDGAMTLDRRWDQVDEVRQLDLAIGRVKKYQPSPDPGSTDSAVVYEEIVSSLVAHGAQVCLVSLPVTPLYVSLIAEYDGYQESIEFFKSIARRPDVNYVDLRNSVQDMSLFADQDHLNVDGALTIAPLLAGQCF